MKSSKTFEKVLYKSWCYIGKLNNFFKIGLKTRKERESISDIIFYWISIYMNCEGFQISIVKVATIL